MRKLALALFLLVLAGCGGDNGATTTATTNSTPPPATTEEPATTETTPPPPPPPATTGPQEETLRISYANGKLAGGITTVKVDKGTRIVLVVTSDVVEEVHVHGPDIKRDLTPGKPARVAFTVTQPGRYEVELEHRGLQIADIQVQP
jgi:hypothetical protein